MTEIKIYECLICKQLAERGVKGQTRFRGTRKDIRKHLVEEHNLKGRKNKHGLNGKEFGESRITHSTISEEFR